MAFTCCSHRLYENGQPAIEWVWHTSVQFRSVTQSCPTLKPHELQHATPPRPSPTPGVHPNSRPSSWWCHPPISSSVVPFSCPQSLPASESFPVSQLFAWGSQSTYIIPNQPLGLEWKVGVTSWIFSILNDFLSLFNGFTCDGFISLLLSQDSFPHCVCVFVCVCVCGQLYEVVVFLLVISNKQTVKSGGVTNFRGSNNKPKLWLLNVQTLCWGSKKNPNILCGWG